jgi:soluble lytic murein transglycosylase-like protein
MRIFTLVPISLCVFVAFLLPDNLAKPIEINTAPTGKITAVAPISAPQYTEMETLAYIETETPVVAPVAPNEPVGDVEAIVRAAANKYGVNPDYLVKIARCESGLNPFSVNRNYYENGNPSGLFQHLSGYYAARAQKYGYSPDVFNAYSNANVTAAMFAEGLNGLWECH